jgi:hypothetical protein
MYLLGASSSFAASFTICNKNNQCETDSAPYWLDKLYRTNPETGENEQYQYRGIAIVSQSLSNNVYLFLKGYNLPGKYELVGTPNDDYAEKRNALITDDMTGTPMKVSQDAPGNSYVEITSDANGKVSGKYRVSVRIDGNKKYDPIEVHGEFKDVPKK